jgi:hypothetical protein
MGGGFYQHRESLISLELAALLGLSMGKIERLTDDKILNSLRVKTEARLKDEVFGRATDACSPDWRRWKRKKSQGTSSSDDALTARSTGKIPPNLTEDSPLMQEFHARLALDGFLKEQRIALPTRSLLMEALKQLKGGARVNLKKPPPLGIHERHEGVGPGSP